MKAKKENKVYSITTEQEKQRYLKQGYDIYDDEGKLLEHSPQKKISYSQYDVLQKENETLKEEMLALCEGNETLREENNTLRKEIMALKEENNTLRKEIMALKEENNVLRGKLESADTGESDIVQDKPETGQERKAPKASSKKAGG